MRIVLMMAIRLIRIIGAAALAIAAVACGSRGDLPPDRHEAPASTSVAASEQSSIRPDARPRIVILGDSLTAGLGLAREDAYPALLQRRLNDRGLKYAVVNAGVSGDTSAGGLSRLDWALAGDVRVLVVALGGNDGLRGLPPEELKHNLEQVIVRAQAQGIQVVLAGMEALPNFGAQYTRAFRAVYPTLA